MKETDMLNQKKPVANPLVSLREEFDDWALLFDPDSGNAFGLNPVGVWIWKRLDGTYSVQDLVKHLGRSWRDVPKGVEDHVTGFIQELLDEGLAGEDANCSFASVHNARGIETT